MFRLTKQEDESLRFQLKPQTLVAVAAGICPMSSRNMESPCFRVCSAANARYR